MQTLISDLLSYSRVATRGKPFEPTDCNAVFEAAENLKTAIAESGRRGDAQTHCPRCRPTARNWANYFKT